MNIRTLGDNDLSDFADNVSDQLTGPDIVAIDSNVRADLVTAIGTLPATLATQTATAAVAEGTRKAAVSSKNETRSQLIGLMSQVRDALRAGLATKKQYDICGFDYPLTQPVPYVPQDPTDLSAFGYSNGINRGRFTGNNRSGLVHYEIWRRQGDDGPWMLHSTAKRQTFTDTPVTPGQYYEYRVRVVASKSVSNFSNSAVVYGVL